MARLIGNDFEAARATSAELLNSRTAPPPPHLDLIKIEFELVADQGHGVAEGKTSAAMTVAPPYPPEASPV